MPGPNGERCEDCYYWDEDLVCCAHPEVSYAPGDHWCGEFKDEDEE